MTTEYADALKLLSCNEEKSIDVFDVIKSLILCLILEAALLSLLADKGFATNVISDYHSLDCKKIQKHAHKGLIANAVEELRLFDGGKTKDNSPCGSRYVEKYWQFLIDKGQSQWKKGRREEDESWSAAFISYVIGQTSGYDNFEYSAIHIYYVHPAILQQKCYPFKAHDVTRSKYKPESGDLICSWRNKKFTYKDAMKSKTNDEGKPRKSHCDLVVKIEKDHLLAIGGNLEKSVQGVKYSLDGKKILFREKNEEPRSLRHFGKYGWFMI